MSPGTMQLVSSSRHICIQMLFKRGLKAKSLGCLKLGQSHKTRLALTPSFLPRPSQRYSTSNMTSVTLL